MKYIIGFIFVMLFLCSPYFRCIVFHPISTIFYATKDILKYIRYKRWREYRNYGTINVFTGLFGHGKTLSSTYFVRKIYKKYNGKKVYDFEDKCWKPQFIHVVSNVTLNDVPFIKLNQMSDLITLTEQESDHVSCWIVLIDEASTQLNSRDFKSNFSSDLLNVMLTCRHYKMALYLTSQRYNLIDKLVRDTTQDCIESHKLWRLVKWSIYDAWTLENVSDVTKVKAKRTKCIFVRDKDFAAYDTLAVVENFKENVKKGLHLTDAEILQFREGAASEYSDLNLKRRYRKKLHK